MSDKFRVYYENGDYPQGRLVYPPEEDDDSPAIVANQHGDLLVIEPGELLQDDYSLSRLRWDAIGVRRDDYTGREDHTGQPVYERDILGHDGELLVVRYWEDGASFRAFLPDAPDGTASYPLASCLSSSGGPQMEVVGNVHQDSNLLDDNDDG